MVIGSALQGASNPSCRPWERCDLLRRLSTFKLAGKLPKVAGSLACAKRGWVIVDVTKIECELCGAQLDFALPSASSVEEADASGEELSKQLDSGHKINCPWRGNSCPESLVQFPPTSASALIGGFKDRSDGLLQFYSLPIVSSSSVEHMRVTHGPKIDSFIAQLQIQTAGELGYRAEASFIGEQVPHSYSYAQKFISLCGWEPRWLRNVLDCEEQSAESAKNGNNSDPAKGSAPDPASSKKEFSTSSRKDTGDSDVLGSEFNCESRSPLFDCSLCGATVRVLDFLTAPCPVHLAPCGTDTYPSNNLESVRNPSVDVPSYSMDIQTEAEGNTVNQLNPEKDHVISMPSTRDSAHASSVIAMNMVYQSSDDESMESEENSPADVNDFNFPFFNCPYLGFPLFIFPSVDLNETSELNSSYQAQQSACIQPPLERAGGEPGLSTSNACGEVLNTEMLTAHARDGPSFGISGRSVGIGSSHEAEIHGTDVSVHRGDSLDDAEPIAEVIENQGQVSEVAPNHGHIGDFVPGEVSREDHQGDSQAVVSQSTARVDSAYHESGHLDADVVGTPYRDNSSGRVEFDPIKLHNDYCPWVNGDVAVAGFDSPCSTSDAGTAALCGWQLTLEALDSFQSLGHLPVQALESESAASMCKGDCFTSSQKLLPRNSYVRNR